MIPQRCKDLANYELASRATGGTLVYIFAATILYFWSPYFRGHTLGFTVFFCLILYFSRCRYRAALFVKARSGVGCEKEVRDLEKCTLASCFTFGVLAAWGVLTHTDLTRWMLVAVVGALAGGAISSLVPSNNHLYTKYAALITLPGIIALLLLPDQTAQASGIMAAAFTTLMIFFGSQQSHIFHTRVRHDLTQVEELEAARERLEMVVEGSSLGTFDWFPLEETLITDHKVWDALGLDKPEEGALEVLWERADPREKAANWAIFRDYLRGKPGGFELDISIRGKNDASVVFRLRGRVVRRFQGRASRVSGTYYDVTAEIAATQEKERWRQQMQQAEKLNTLGLLAGGVAHDFNNLLTAFVGSLELIALEAGDDAPFMPELELAKSSAMEASGLCDQLLSYAGRQAFRQEKFCLNRLISRMTQLLSVSTGPNVGIDLKLGEGPMELVGDDSQLRQVVLNLILNAAEAMPDGGVVQVRTSRNGGWLELSVADTGCGMDQETVERIFDPFFTTKFTGRGLGLAAVFGIAQGHGGKIDVASTPGSGTTMRVTLPVANLVDKELPATIGTSDGKLSSAHCPLIMVVDDEPAVRMFYEKILTPSGVQVVTACDGMEALERLSRKPVPNLIILDLTMPKLGGVETLKRLRQDFPNLPVILASGFSQNSIDPRELPEFQGFLKKPFTASQLHDSLLSALATGFLPPNSSGRALSVPGPGKFCSS